MTNDEQGNTNEEVKERSKDTIVFPSSFTVDKAHRSYPEVGLLVLEEFSSGEGDEAGSAILEDMDEGC